MKYLNKLKNKDPVLFSLQNSNYVKHINILLYALNIYQVHHKKYQHQQLKIVISISSRQFSSATSNQMRIWSCSVVQLVNSKRP